MFEFSNRLESITKVAFLISAKLYDANSVLKVASRSTFFAFVFGFGYFKKLLSETKYCYFFFNCIGEYIS